MATSSVALVNGQKFPISGSDTNRNVVKNVTSPYQHHTDRVSPCSALNEVSTEKEMKWFLMRAAYGQEKKAESILTGEDGIGEVFIPQWIKERTYGGKKKKVLVSMIPNTLFVKSTEKTLHRYIGKSPLSYLHHCYQPNIDSKGRLIGTGRTPIVIPEYQMVSFRKWVEADVSDKLYKSETFTFKENDVVRITEGDFAGFIGHIVRLKGQTRVGINIEGVGFISTTYIPKSFLEIVNK